MDENVIVIVVAAVGILLGVALIVAFFMRIICQTRMWSNYFKTTTNEMTGEECANFFVGSLALENVAVKTSYFYKDGYSAWRKRIFLSRKTGRRKSISSVAVATRQVVIAQLYAEGDKTIKKRQILGFVFNTPVFLMVPMILLGVVVDMATKSSVGIFTLILTIVAAVFYLISFIYMLVSLKGENVINQRAIQLLEGSGFLTEEELPKVKKIYKSLKILSVAEFIISTLYLIWITLKLIFFFVNNK